MKEWWEGLQASEQRILALGAVALVLIFAFFGIWQPLQKDVVSLEQEVEQQRAIKRWMTQAAAEVKQLRGNGAAVARPKDGRSLLAVVDQTAKRSGLGAGLKRLEPDGQAAVKVWLEQVKFDDMVRWLNQLQSKNALSVDSITIDRQDEPGRVNARMTLEAAG